MKHYIVLRNNKENGPYSREELQSFGLAEADLIWIEGESTTWEHPGAIEDLKFIAVNSPQTVLPNRQKPLSPVTETKAFSLEEYLENYRKESSFASPSSSEKTPPQPAEKGRQDSFVLLSKLFGFGILLAGLLLCSFVVNQMMKTFSAEKEQVSKAVEIKAERLPVSSTHHAALSLPQNQESPSPGATVPERTDTISLQPTPATKSNSQIPQKAPQQTRKKEDPAIKQVSTQDIAPDETPPPSEEVVPEPPVPVDYKSALRLSANEFKTGLFGGISDLEISITNSSSKKIARAMIEVDFLKPNGNVVKTQTLTAEDIAAGVTRSVPVPSSNRGVKVQYRVVSAEPEN